MEEVVFPREGHTNWLSNAKWSAWKTSIQVTLFRVKQVVSRYLGIYMYVLMHIYAATIIRKEAVNVKASKEVSGKIWRGGKGKICNYIIISKLNIIF